jgi:hypothetical protein
VLPAQCALWCVLPERLHGFRWGLTGRPCQLHQCKLAVWSQLLLLAPGCRIEHSRLLVSHCNTC